ncbi:MAG: response regulator [Lachnospiraceae bacterium]|nr:response regulator [Lachnospiraceae bacterium]
MEKRVLIISTSETFTVKGLESKLAEIGISSDYATTKIDRIEHFLNRAEFFVYYLDESSGKSPELPIFLNETCTEKEKKMVVIGARLEYEAVSKYFDSENLIQWFERPLNMGKFLTCVHTYLESASMEAEKKAILIVDDDVAYMQMVRKWLKDEYRVGMANSGIQAITWLARNKADLILLDYNMPVTSGPTVLEMMRTEAETSSIPVMFLTGRSDRVSIQRVMSLHPADYLLKTIEKPALLEKLHAFFEKQESEHPEANS